MNRFWKFVYRIFGVKTAEDEEMFWAYLTKIPTRRKPNEKFGDADGQL